MNILFLFCFVVIHLWSQEKDLTKDFIERNSEGMISINDYESQKISQYLPPYKSDIYRNLYSQNIPKLSNPEGLLKNLDSTFWRLKFYDNPDVSIYQNVEAFIQDSFLMITVKDKEDRIVDKKKYYLNVVKMLTPNEGIFAYADQSSHIFFVYLRLLLPHLLGIEMTGSYEEAEKIFYKSVTEIGIFTLQ